MHNAKNDEDKKLKHLYTVRGHKKIKKCNVHKMGMFTAYTRRQCIFSIRKNVKDHNDLMLDKLDHETHKKIQALTRIPSSVTSFDVNSKVSDLPHVLELAPNAHVMLIKNLDVNDGLVNGATGLVLDLICHQNVKPPSLPKCVIVQFDDPSCGLLTRQASTISLANYPGGTLFILLKFGNILEGVRLHHKLLGYRCRLCYVLLALSIKYKVPL